MGPLPKSEEVQKLGDVVSPALILVPGTEGQMCPGLVPNIVVPTLFSETGSYGSTLLLNDRPLICNCL